MLGRFYRHWLQSFAGINKDIWLLSFVNFINRLGSMVVIFLTIYLTEIKGYSIEQTGYILTANGFGAVIGTYLGGWLTDRFGYYKLQIIALHLQGLVLFILPHINGAPWIALTVLIMSITSESIRPANSVAFMVHSEPESRTRSISLNRMGVNLSFTAAPAIGGLLVKWSWLAIFIVDGITCILAAWLMIFYLSEKQAPQISSHKNQPSQKVMGSPWTDLPFMAFIGLTVINAVVFMQLIWTIPYFFQNAYGWDKTFIGFVLAINGFIVAIVEMPLIYRIEKQYPVLGLVRTGLIFYAASYLVLALGFSPLLAAGLFIILISFGEIYVMPFSTTYVMDASGTTRKGQYMAMYSLAYASSQVLAPLLGTQTIAHLGFDWLWYILGALSAVSFIGLRLLEKKQEAKLTLA